jgi:hypothetical protein
VLAATGSGAVLSIDLRMLGRSWTEWPMVVERATGGGVASRESELPHSRVMGTPSWLTGDARTLLVARRDGGMVGIFGRSRYRDGGDGGAKGGDEAKAEYRERMKQASLASYPRKLYPALFWVRFFC